MEANQTSVYKFGTLCIYKKPHLNHFDKNLNHFNKTLILGKCLVPWTLWLQHEITRNKIATKIKKCETEAENNNNKYRNSIRDITNYNPKYQEDMNYEFNLCQEFEKIRRDIVKEKLESLVSCLDRRIFIKK